MVNPLGEVELLGRRRRRRGREIADGNPISATARLLRRLKRGERVYELDSVVLERVRQRPWRRPVSARAQPAAKRREHEQLRLERCRHVSARQRTAEVHGREREGQARRSGVLPSGEGGGEDHDLPPVVGGHRDQSEVGDAPAPRRLVVRRPDRAQGRLLRLRQLAGVGAARQDKAGVPELRLPLRQERLGPVAPPCPRIGRDQQPIGQFDRGLGIGRSLDRGSRVAFLPFHHGRSCRQARRQPRPIEERSAVERNRRAGVEVKHEPALMRGSDRRLAGPRRRRAGRLPRRLGECLRREQNSQPGRLGRVIDDQLRASAVRRVNPEIDALENKVDEVIGADELEPDLVAASRCSSRSGIEIWTARFDGHAGGQAASSFVIFSHSTGER